MKDIYYKSVSVSGPSWQRKVEEHAAIAGLKSQCREMGKARQRAVDERIQIAFDKSEARAAGDVN